MRASLEKLDSRDVRFRASQHLHGDAAMIAKAYAERLETDRSRRIRAGRRR
jgi:hypothetical protein